MTVLITAPYHDEGLKELTELFRTVHLVEEAVYREDELIRMIQETNASGLITELDEVSERVIDILPDTAFIGVCRGMPSNVNIAAATKRKIPVFFTPTAMPRLLLKCLSEM